MILLINFHLFLVIIAKLLEQSLVLPRVSEAQIPAEYYKAILTVAEDTKSTREWNALMRGIMAIFDEVWTSGSYPGEADIPEPVHIRTTAEAIGNRNRGPLFKPDEFG